MFCCCCFFLCGCFCFVFWGEVIFISALGLCYAFSFSFGSLIFTHLHANNFFKSTLFQKASPQTWCCPRCALTRTNLTDSTSYLQMWMTSWALLRSCQSERYQCHHAFAELPLMYLNGRCLCHGLFSIFYKHFGWYTSGEFFYTFRLCCGQNHGPIYI